MTVDKAIKSYGKVNPTTTCPLCGDKGGVAWHVGGDGFRCGVCRAIIQWEPLIPGDPFVHKVPIVWAREKEAFTDIVPSGPLPPVPAVPAEQTAVTPVKAALSDWIKIPGLEAGQWVWMKKEALKDAMEGLRSYGYFYRMPNRFLPGPVVHRDHGSFLNPMPEGSPIWVLRFPDGNGRREHRFGSPEDAKAALIRMAREYNYAVHE